MLNFRGLSSDSAGDLRRRRSRLGRLASEGPVEIKADGDEGVSFRASHLGEHR